MVAARGQFLDTLNQRDVGREKGGFGRSRTGLKKVSDSCDEVAAPNPICPSDSGGRARHVTKLYKNYVVQILESELVLTYLCKAVSQCN